MRYETAFLAVSKREFEQIAQCFIDEYDSRAYREPCTIQRSSFADERLIAAGTREGPFAGFAKQSNLHTEDGEHADLKLVLAIPSGRLTRAHAVRALASSYVKIHSTRLGGGLLPRDVVNAYGKMIAACRADYLPKCTRA